MRKSFIQYNRTRLPLPQLLSDTFYLLMQSTPCPFVPLRRTTNDWSSILPGYFCHLKLWLHSLTIIHKSVILLFENITMCADQIILPHFLFRSLMENTVSTLNILTTSCEDARRACISYNHFFESFWFSIILEVPNPICYTFLFSKSLSLWA